MSNNQPRIGYNNKINKNCIIEPNVKIGDNNYFGNYCIVKNGVEIGNNNYFSDGCIIGGQSNHVLRKQNESENIEKNHSYLIRIGNENIFGEYVTIHLPVLEATIIKNFTNIGSKSHLAHDSIISDKAIVSINCGIGGYVNILEGANIGIGVNIHPRLVIGQFSMLGVGTTIINHIFPFVTVVGQPQKYLKVNEIGLSRNGFSTEELNEVKLIIENGYDKVINSKRILDCLLNFNNALKQNYINNKSIIPTNINTSLLNYTSTTK